jgi:hypothetical protein
VASAAAIVGLCQETVWTESGIGKSAEEAAFATEGLEESTTDSWAGKLEIVATPLHLVMNASVGRGALMAQRNSCIGLGVADGAQNLRCMIDYGRADAASNGAPGQSASG